MEYTTKSGSKILALIACGMLSLALLSGCFAEPNPTTEPTTVETVPSGIIAGGVDVSGMEPEQLTQAIIGAAEKYAQPITVRIEDQEYVLTMTPILDADAAAAAILEAQAGDFDLRPYLSVDEQALAVQLNAWEAIHTVEAVPTSWTLAGEMPSLEPMEEEPVCQSLILVKGTTGKTLDREALARDIRNVYTTGVYSVTGTVTTQEQEEFDLVALHAEHDIAPVDAVMDMTTFEVTPETYGYTFDLEAAQAAWEEATEGDDILIPFHRVAPAVSAESLSSLLYRDVLGSCSTYLTNDYNRNSNIKLACSAINGIVLMPGQTFSFNGATGLRTAEKGYLPAGAYSGGQVVTSLGGGICQVSSTIYNSALLSDLDIVARSNHAMTVGYVKLGLDATVYLDVVDLRFRNNTDYPIRIEAWVSGGYIHTQIVGTDLRDYYIKMVYEVTETIPYETVYEEMYADNEKGYKDGDVITSPFTGYKVTSYRCRYSKETDARISTEWEANSTYKKVDQVICRIIEKPTEPTEPTEPPATEPEPTEPPATDPEPTEPPVTEPEPTEHQHSYTQEVTPSTCTAEGKILYICACGYSYEEVTPAMGHSYTSEVIEPTETEQGYTLHVCTRCGDSHKDNFTDPVPPPSTEPEPTETEPAPTEATEPTSGE